MSQLRATAPEPAPVVDVVVPVYNEAHVLEKSVERLRHYLAERFPLPFGITIVDNGSTDGTWAEARRLAARPPQVHALHLDEQGRCRALRAARSSPESVGVACPDVDPSPHPSA